MEGEDNSPGGKLEMRRFQIPPLIAVSAILCLCFPGSGYAFREYRGAWDISVAVHVSMHWPAEQATVSFNYANQVIQDYDASCDPADIDTPPCIILRLQGTQAEFGDGYDGLYDIDNDDELNVVFDVPYNIKVVHSIRNVQGVVGYVGGVTKALGVKNIVLDGDGSDGMIWAHEWGHAIGFDDDPACEYYLMYGTYTGVQKVINRMDSADWEIAAPITLYGQFCGTAVGTSFAAVGGDHSVTLSWTESDPSRNVTYIISSGDNCWGPFQPVVAIQSQDPTYTSDNIHYTYVDTAASYARTYYYRLAVQGELVS